MAEKASSDELQGVKRSWGRRLLSTGKIAASAARLATRRVFGTEGETDKHIGEALTRELDGMKGMAMKVGQILSHFEGILPAETHRALQALQHGVKPVAFNEMRQVIEEAFDAPLTDLFEAFDEKAVAAASIGQVYRATYDGHEVAVKVQYPGIQDTIDADFSVLQKLSRLASLATAVDGPAIVKELQARFDEECDYRREATHQRAFAEAFATGPLATDPAISIPDVYPARSCATVLTSAWCKGQDFYTFCETATPERRQVVAKTLVRFAYHSLFGLGTLNADPHPGNYLFPDDDRVVFLDFGCVRRFETDFVAQERRLARVLVENRRHDFEAALCATGMVPTPKRFDFDHHWAMLRHQYAPYCQPHFRFTPDYLKQGFDYSKPSNPNLRHLAIPPQWIWLQRLQWGLHSVLMHLQAEGNFQELFLTSLDLPPTPLLIDEAQ